MSPNGIGDHKSSEHDSHPPSVVTFPTMIDCQKIIFLYRSVLKPPLQVIVHDSD